MPVEGQRRHVVDVGHGLVEGLDGHLVKYIVLFYFNVEIVISLSIC